MKNQTTNSERIGMWFRIPASFFRTYEDAGIERDGIKTSSYRTNTCYLAESGSTCYLIENGVICLLSVGVLFYLLW